MGNKKLKILSIFQRDNYSGRIYIEAPKQSVIEKFTTGVPDIYPAQKLAFNSSSRIAITAKA